MPSDEAPPTTLETDLIAEATRKRWSATVLLEHIVAAELEDRQRRSVERRLTCARLGRFKPLADWDWNWPTTFDRPALERILTLDFLARGENVILVGAQGLGKTSPTTHAPPTFSSSSSAAATSIARYSSPPIYRSSTGTPSSPNASCAVALARATANESYFAPLQKLTVSQTSVPITRANADAYARWACWCRSIATQINGIPACPHLGSRNPRHLRPRPLRAPV